MLAALTNGQCIGYCKELLQRYPVWLCVTPFLRHFISVTSSFSHFLHS